MSDLQCPATVLVVRHGESEGNVLRRMSAAAPGSPLSPRGVEQARELARGLLGRRVARVYASPLLRAQQTGAEIAAVLGTDLRTLDGVREFDLGDLEGSTDPQGWAQVDALFLRWLDGELDAAVGAGETGRQVLARMAEALEGVADLHRGETVVVVSHGGAMGLALPVLAGGPAPHVVRGRPLPNVGLVEIEGDADGWRLVSWPAGPDERAHPGDLVDLLGRADAERNRGTGDSGLVGGAWCAHLDLPFAWATQAAFTGRAETPQREDVAAAVAWLDARAPGCWHLVVRGEQSEQVASASPVRVRPSLVHGVWACRSTPQGGLPEGGLPGGGPSDGGPAGLEIGPATDADEVLSVYGRALEPLVRGRIGVVGDDFLVARHRGEVVACARVRSLAGTAYVCAVTVSPAHRRRGIGRAVSAAATRLGLRDHPVAWLHCEDHLGGLYAALGYERVTTHVHLAPVGAPD